MVPKRMLGLAVGKSPKRALMMGDTPVMLGIPMTGRVLTGDAISDAAYPGRASRLAQKMAAARRKDFMIRR
jgi:hypothetical protein